MSKIRWTPQTRGKVYDAMFDLLGAELKNAWTESGYFRSSMENGQAFRDAQEAVGLPESDRRLMFSVYEQMVLLVEHRASKSEQKPVERQEAAPPAPAPTVIEAPAPTVVEAPAPSASPPMQLDLERRVAELESLVLELMDKVNALESRPVPVVAATFNRIEPKQRLIVVGVGDNEFAHWKRRLHDLNGKRKVPFKLSIYKSKAGTYGTFAHAFIVSGRMGHSHYDNLKTEAKRLGVEAIHVSGGMTGLLNAFSELPDTRL